MHERGACARLAAARPPSFALSSCKPRLPGSALSPRDPRLPNNPRLKANRSPQPAPGTPHLAPRPFPAPSNPCRSALSLRDLRLSNNPRLKGYLPDGFGALSDLGFLEVENTAMRGRPASGNPNDTGDAGGRGWRLPCFLRQADRDMESVMGYPNMRWGPALRIRI